MHPTDAPVFLLDLDDTLVGWSDAERAALKDTFQVHLRPLGLRDEIAWQAFRRVLEENHAAFHRTGRWWYARDRLQRLVELLHEGGHIDAPPAVAGRAAASPVAANAIASGYAAGAGTSIPLVDRMEATFRTRAHDHLHHLDGALRLLDHLRGRGRRTALLTNGPAVAQREKVVRMALQDPVDHVAISGETGHWKPHPEAFLAALAALGADPEDAVMVGDSIYFDIAPAKALGLTTVWVSSVGGEHPAADHVVQGPADLLRLLT